MALRPSNCNKARAAYRNLPVAALTLLAAWVLGACGEAPKEEFATSQSSLALPGFGLRGRVDQPEILWQCEDDLKSATRRAALLWNEEPGMQPRFREYIPTKDGERSLDLQIAWRSGVHDHCPPFGTESSVAHTGALPLPTFIHLDLDRDWDEENRILTLAHEFGHVLGLAHSIDERALMYAEPSSRTPRITQMERRGLQTLYGPHEGPNPDDLVLRVGRGGGIILRGVAPTGRSEFGLIEITGDDRPELAVWRTDAEGFGALTFYLFVSDSSAPESSPRFPLRVERTIGPIYGLYAPGAELSVGYEEAEIQADVPLFILEWPHGRFGARPMDRFGRPGVRMPGPLRLLDGREDTDGDGVFDDSLGGFSRSLASDVEADLDGDGLPERISRP